MALGMGFDYFYGFMGGDSSQWQPYLFQNTTQIFPGVGKPDYNLITDEADNAIDHIKQLNAVAPDKPFFVYYVPGATTRRTTRPRSGSTSSRASSTWVGTKCASRFSPTRKSSA